MIAQVDVQPSAVYLWTLTSFCQKPNVLFIEAFSPSLGYLRLPIALCS